MEILEWTENYNDRERELIKEHHTLSPKGYNIAIGGEEPPHYYGMDHHNGKITEQQLEIIIDALIANHLTQTQIGKLFDPAIRQCTINNINLGFIHNKNDIKYPISSMSPYHLNSTQIDEIIWLIKETEYPFYQIAEHYKVNVSSIKQINTGKNHFNKNFKYPIRINKGRKQLQPVEAILAKRSTTTIDT